MSIRFQELGLKLEDGRAVLEGVSGTFLPGRMVVAGQESLERNNEELGA